MFEQTFVDTQTRVRQPWTMAASATLQTGLVGLLILIPLLHPEGPLMRLDAPPVIYRPVTVVPQPPIPVNLSRPTRATSLLFSDVLRGPTKVPREIATFTDVPEFTGPISPFPAQTGLPFDAIVGAIPERTAPPVVRPATQPPVERPPAPVMPLRVSTSVQAALLIFGPKPVYPPLAKAARVQGTVRLQAVIGIDGTIRNLRLTSGPPLLVQAAMAAVQQWRYRPTVLNGSPVEVATEVDVNFTLTQ